PHRHSYVCSAPAPWLSASYTLSLHDALPISSRTRPPPPAISTVTPEFPSWAMTTAPSSVNPQAICPVTPPASSWSQRKPPQRWRSEEHTSELQSRFDLVCRLLLEKKKWVNDN